MKMEPGDMGMKVYGDFGGSGVTVVGYVLGKRHKRAFCRREGLGQVE